MQPIDQEASDKDTHEKQEGKTSREFGDLLAQTDYTLAEVRQITSEAANRAFIAKKQNKAVSAQ